MLTNRLSDDLLVTSTRFLGTKKLVECVSDVGQPSVFKLNDGSSFCYSHLKFINIDYGIIIKPLSLFYEECKTGIPFCFSNVAFSYPRMIGEQSWYIYKDYIRWITHISIDIGGEELIIL